VPALYSSLPGPQLFDDSGAPIAASLVADPEQYLGRFLVPGAPLTAGAGYRLRYWVDCVGGGSPDGGAWHEQRFTAGPAAANPAALAPVSPTDEGMRLLRVDTVRGSCVYGIPAVAVRLAITLPPEATPWLSIARVSTDVDGQRWAATYWGGYDPTSGASCNLFHTARTADVVFARCGPHDSYADRADDNGIEPGHHTATVVFQIPQGATIAASTDFDLTCIDIPGLDGGYIELNEPFDGGCLPPAWQTHLATPAAPDAGSPAPPSKKGRGCGFSAGGSSIVLVPLAAALRRRRPSA
jgi:hypothetical protein